MKAVVRHRYGTADALGVVDIERPAVGPENVCVRVAAAGVDPGVWHVMTGTPYLVRLAGYGVRAPKEPVLGTDLAGVVDAVGENVTRFRPGDAVFGVGRGTFAEYTCTEQTKLAAKPAKISFAQAAAVPTSALTALQAVRDHGRMRSGHRVLIIGASGGVGTHAVQLAKLWGAHVTGTCSTSKVDLVRSVGADSVIDYTRGDIAADGRRYDVVLDIGGNRPVSTLRRVLTSTGTLVIVGGRGGRWMGGFQRQLWASAVSPFVRQRLGTFIAKQSQDDLHLLRTMLDSGRIAPVVDRTYPLPFAGHAIEAVRSGAARGKIVLTL